MIVNEFIAKYPQVTMTHSPRGKHIIDGKTPFVWDVAIQINKAVYQTTYTMGAAHIGRKGVYNTSKITPLSYYEGKKLIEEDKHRAYGIKRLVPIPPTLDGVLYSLANDCQSFRNAPTWVAFANDLGYNSDSIKDKKVFKACRKCYTQLMSKMSYQMFADFLEITEE